MKRPGPPRPASGWRSPAWSTSTHGVVAFAPNLGWHDVPLAARLSAALGPLRVPVSVDNDANLAALAEHTSGVAAGTPHLVYLTGEVGVGGGIFVDGRLLRGADGFSGEVGHLPVDPAAGAAAAGGRLLGDQGGPGRAGADGHARPGVPSRAGPPVSDPEEHATEIAGGLAAGDPQMTDAVAQVGRWLGRGGSILANLFNPRVIVVGGYFATLAEWLLPHAQAELERLVVAGPANQCRFVASDLGFGAASRGAASMVVNQIIDHPTMIMDPLPSLSPI